MKSASFSVPGGNSRALKSAHGILTYSACPPGRHELCERLVTRETTLIWTHSDITYIRISTSLTLIVLLSYHRLHQRNHSPCWPLYRKLSNLPHNFGNDHLPCQSWFVQHGWCLHATLNGMTTRSPTLSFCTPEPTSSMIPMLQGQSCSTVSSRGILLVAKDNSGICRSPAFILFPVRRDFKTARALAYHMKVRSAYGRRGNFDNNVVWIDYFWLRNGLNIDFERALPDHSLHLCLSA